MATGVMDRAVDFAAACLKKNPNMPMAEMSKLARKEGINIYPLVIGKAKTRLGLSKAKPAPGAPKRGPGRPRKNPAAAAPAASSSSRGTGASALGDVAALVQRLHNDLNDCQARLAQISKLASG